MCDFFGILFLALVIMALPIILIVSGAATILSSISLVGISWDFITGNTESVYETKTRRKSNQFLIWPKTIGNETKYFGYVEWIEVYVDTLEKWIPLEWKS